MRGRTAGSTTRGPPDQAPPDQAPPDQAPPDQAPPDQAPPDQAPPADGAPPDPRPPDQGRGHPIAALPTGVVLPPLRTLLGGIGLQVVEGTLVPSLLFWAVLHTGGLVPALLSALAWCYLAIARRWVRGAALPAVLVLGALLFTTRTGLALAYSSTFVYLLTPTINAFVLAGAFAGSALLRRPLTERFARDFVGLPASVTALHRVQRVLRRLSMIWAAVNVLNGAIALQLLVAEHYDAVLLVRSLLAPLLTAVAVACCFDMGRRALHAEGIALHLRWRDPAPA